MKQTMLLQSATAALCAVGFCALSSRPLLGAPARPATSAPASRPSADVVPSVDDKEQEDVLLGRHSDGVVARTAARMDESARRLARELDPGRQTQEVQRRILDDIEDLIDALNKDKADAGKGGGAGQADKSNPKGGADGQQKTGAADAPSASDAAAARSDQPAPSGIATPPPSGDLADRREAFLQISPRLRPAVIEGATEQVSAKYRRLTEDYYKAVARAQR